MFIKRSLHNFQGTFSYFISSRMAYDELTKGTHAQEAQDAQDADREDGGEKPSRDDEVEKAGAERDGKKEEVSRDTGKKLTEHLGKVESKKSALEKVANIIKESPESIKNAFYNYKLAEHNKPNRIEQAEAQRIIQKIIDAKKEHKLDGITFIYLGGTNGQRHDLNKLEKTRDETEQKEWHQKKSDAFGNILLGKDKIQPVELQTLISNNEGLIKEYREKVAANSASKLKTFLVANDAAFCDAAGLFDLALAYQRAEDLYGVINEGRELNPLEDVITLDLKTGAGSEDLRNCRSKIEFTMPEEAKGELVPGPTPPGGELKRVKERGPNDLPEPDPNNPPEDKSDKTPPPPQGELVEKAAPAATIEAKLFADPSIDSVKYKDQLDKAKEVLNSLDTETKRRLNLLAQPFLTFKNSLQPKIDDGEGGSGYYYVRIDIRNTPEDIKKNLENAARMIVEERFLPNTPKEEKALEDAQKKGLPFKNIRQAYVEDMKRSPKIDWDKSNGTPIAPNEWVDKDQNQNEWFNYAIETPAERAERIKKGGEDKESKKDEGRKNRELEAAKNAAESEAAREEAAKKEADPEDVENFKKALEEFNTKREAFNSANGMKLVSHFDTFKGPYLAADIDEYTQTVKDLSSGIDRFGGIFGGMSTNTKNILKSVELTIDQENGDKKKPERNISRNKDGNYQLWFNISKEAETVKKDLIAQKNKFVKGGYKKDSPLEAAERATVGDAFKNSREAYASKGKDKKRYITYNAGEDKWEPAKGRKWAGTLTYDYSTIGTPEEPVVPTPAPKPGPERKPESAPEVPYEAASTDSIKLSDADYTIKTKQKINGTNEIDTYTLDNKIAVSGEPRRINTPDGKVMALKITTGGKPVGYIYLDKTGKMKARMESGYAIRIQDKIITVSKKREL